MVATVVVLPAPFNPRRTVVLPSSTSKSIPCSTGMAPNRLFSSTKKKMAKSSGTHCLKFFSPRMSFAMSFRTKE